MRRQCAFALGDRTGAQDGDRVGGLETAVADLEERITRHAAQIAQAHARIEAFEGGGVLRASEGPFNPANFAAVFLECDLFPNDEARTNEAELDYQLMCYEGR